MIPVTRRVFRVQWTPGTDRLLAVCHCGAEEPADDPVQAWEWLLAHPDGHENRRYENCRGENGRAENSRAENGRGENGLRENSRAENGRGLENKKA